MPPPVKIYVGFNFRLVYFSLCCFLCLGSKLDVFAFTCNADVGRAPVSTMTKTVFAGVAFAVGIKWILAGCQERLLD